MEWVSRPFQGYLIVTYVANIDNDENREIVLNVYVNNNESYFLSMWSFDNGTNRVVGLEEFGIMEQLPSYPNPFNSSTIIPFILNGNSSVVIDIVNLNGQRVKRLTNKNYPQGKFQVRWNGKNDQNQHVSCGVYMVRIMINNIINAQPIVLTK
ncbi:MAG: FlgD immunoglobulin-like domain containing protein [Fidelibacterota bacterium]